MQVSKYVETSVCSDSTGNKFKRQALKVHRPPRRDKHDGAMLEQSTQGHELYLIEGTFSTVPIIQLSPVREKEIYCIYVLYVQ